MSIEETLQRKIKQSKRRSPAYPFISLETALEKARKFYSSQTRHSAPMSAALALWDFGAKSSGGLQTVSALKQFGLLGEEDVSGTRQVRLTEAALRIIQDEREPSPERDAEIKRLALLPKIYAEMWAKWGSSLPGDATVKFYLVNVKKYNERAFADLFEAYKDTIKFATLVESDKDVRAAGNGSACIDLSALSDGDKPNSYTPTAQGAELMEGERIVFTHEVEPSHGVRILASGDVDDSVLDALELYIQLQKKRLERERNASKKIE